MIKFELTRDEVNTILNALYTERDSELRKSKYHSTDERLRKVFKSWADRYENLIFKIEMSQLRF